MKLSMCGIFGWIVGSEHVCDETLLRRATNRLAHRGPDGYGAWIGMTSNRSHQIAFGHRRLSIIDIAGGSQPMWSYDNRFIIAFNGEIYNYVELRDELITRGHRFSTKSDTEVIIEAVRAWGVQSVPRFRGMFAFALFDARDETVLLARDAFGKKPLFVSESDKGIIFGSEITALLEVPWLDRALDWSALDDFLLFNYVPGPSTLFRGIKKLPPGSTAVWKRGKLEVDRFFVPPFAATDPDVFDEDAADSLFSTVLDEAVRLRMRSDAPFGAFLSGGIDSSAIVAIMSRYSTGPVKTFSVGFDQLGYSELEYAREVACAFGTDHEELVVSANDFLDTWPEALLRRGAPVSQTSDIPILLLSHVAQSKVKMVLTGEGSDELLAGYPKHKAERWIERYQCIVPASVHDAVVRLLVDRLPFGFRRAKILARALSERNLKDRMPIWFGAMSASERADLLARAAYRSNGSEYPFSCARGSCLRRTLYFDQTSWLPDNLLERGDRMMMGGSIEGRMPFMDTELALVAARLPDRFFADHARGKAILRRVLRGVLPERILERKKIGFRVPIDLWFRGPLKETLRDLLDGENSIMRKICDRTKLKKLVSGHLGGHQNRERELWALANLEMFLRTFRPAL